MWDFDYSSCSSIKFLLSQNNLKMTKKRGQNFLIDNNIRNKIANLILDGVLENDNIWEIGPGLGSLTSLLVKSKKNIKVFELDYGFIEILKTAFQTEQNFSIVSGDALETVKSVWDDTPFDNRPFVISGNLPYNVGTVLIALMLENRIFPHRMVFTLQKEVAERMVSNVGDDDWGSLATLTSLTYNKKIMFDVSPSSFWPSPNIKSSVILLEKISNNSFDYDNYDKFIKLNRVVFAQKRKTIKNNLLQVFGDKTDSVLKQIKVDPSARPNLIKIEDIVKLCEYV